MPLMKTMRKLRAIASRTKRENKDMVKREEREMGATKGHTRPRKRDEYNGEYYGIANTGWLKGEL